MSLRIAAAVAGLILILAIIVGLTAAAIEACPHPRGREWMRLVLWTYGAGSCAGLGVVNGVAARLLHTPGRYAAVSGLLFCLFLFIILTQYSAVVVCNAEEFVAVSTINGTRSLPSVSGVATASIPIMPLLPCVLVHFFVIHVGRVPPKWYRGLVAYAAYVMTTTMMLLLLFSPLIALIGSVWLAWIPNFALWTLSVWGLYQSVLIPELKDWEYVTIDLPTLTRDAPSICAANSNRVTCISEFDASRDAFGGARPKASNMLRLVQITDPHMGSLMPPTELRRICQDAVAADPDIVLVTGDMLTVEGNRARAQLAEALAPLSQLPGKVFACYGNHDIESPSVQTMVTEVLGSVGATLLVDATVTVATRLGPIEVVGLRYAFPWERESHIKGYFPIASSGDGGAERQDGGDSGSPRAVADAAGAGPVAPVPPRASLVMLHDPSSFGAIPRRECPSLVFAGHTHGGHIGFFTCGCRHITPVRCCARIPDNGLWASATGNVLYCHRGQGSRSLLSNSIVRLGVPNEHSVLDIVV